MQPARIKDSLQLYGELTVTLYDVKTGKRIRRMQKRNQIVNDGRIVVCDLLVGNDQIKNKIGYLGIGTGTVPPQITDSALLGEVYRDFLDPIPPEIYVDPVNFEVVISKLIAAGIADGQILSEAGLFTYGDNLGVPEPNSKLYARQTHPPFEKTPTTAVTYDWRLGITVQV
jgi:hypothetical protein